MAPETYTVVGTIVHENGVPLKSVIDPDDVFVLELACLANRLEWQGYEALFENGKWTISLQQSTGLKNIKTVSTVAQVWLFVNGWADIP